MKRFITLMMALTLVFCAVANSSAAEIKAKGSFTMEYAWMDNTNFSNGDATGGDGTSEDDFLAQQRVRTQIDVVANENLSGVLYFEIDNRWGGGDGATLSSATGRVGASRGGALGADGVNIETKRAFIDWTVPNTALSVRMGIQGLALPSAALGNTVLDDDVAAAVATYKFNDMLSVTGFWARPWDANTSDSNSGNTSNDEIDLFGLIGGIKLDGMQFTPYAMYGRIGSEAPAAAGLSSLAGAQLASQSGLASSINATKWGSIVQSPLGVTNVGFNGTDNLDNSDAYWLGLAFTLDMFDPVVLKLDAVYGAVDNNDFSYNAVGYNATSGTVNGTGNYLTSDDDILDRAGWAVAAKLSYKMDMVTPGLIGWYGSGEDDDIENGSERLPVIIGNFAPTSFGFHAAKGGFANPGTRAAESVTGDLLGRSLDGKWGAGLVLEDIKVIDSLTSQFRVVYVEGTNDADVLDFYSTAASKASFLQNNVGYFMTDKDEAWEINFDHKVDIYENLAMYVEMGYVNLDLDESAWGITSTGNDYDDDAYKLSIMFQYSF